MGRRMIKVNISIVRFEILQTRMCSNSVMTDMALCLHLPLVPYIVLAKRKGSIKRLAWAFPDRHIMCTLFLQG